MSKPSFLERRALGALFNHLTSHNPDGYKDYFWDDYKELKPIKTPMASPYRYYSTIKKFPHDAKRYLIQSLLLGWNIHHDINTLYKGITTLIYLKVCEVSEYFFLQQIYNFLIHFKGVCKSVDLIEIESYTPDKYTLRFWKDNSLLYQRESYGIIEFELEELGQEPVLVIVPWYRLVNSCRGYEENTKYNVDDQRILLNELHLIMCKEFAKKQCHWINSSWDLKCYNDEFDRGLIIVMCSLKYADTIMDSNKVKTFNFAVDAEQFIYSFSLPILEKNATISTGESTKVECVITSILRHPEFVGIGKVSHPLFANGQEARTITDFEEDFDKFFRKLNDMQQQIEHEMLQQVLQQLCEEHINTYGRLMYVDLLMLIDVFICVDHAIYSRDLENYHRIYKREVYRILNTFPKDVKFTNSLGELYSWADV